MRKILANDGIHPTGKKLLEDAGFLVNIDHIAQDDLPSLLNEYEAIIVRSATKVRKELIDASPNLKLIARAGVGMDNIDVEYGRNKGLHVVNTPSASSRSVAELVFGHFISLSRGLYKANREMPSKGNQEFKSLKKSYSKGIELNGKTLGVIGLGRIGCETIKIGAGLGMNVIGHDPFVDSKTISTSILGQEITLNIQSVKLNDLLSRSDFISLHIPFLGKAIISTDEFAAMKQGVILVNAARGGVVDEEALLNAIDNDIVRAAGLDVFINEPNPDQAILINPKISLSPHIGASTMDAQEKIGVELATQIIERI